MLSPRTIIEAGVRQWRIATTLFVAVTMIGVVGGLRAGTAAAAAPVCQPGANLALFITPNCDDPAFGQPYTDVDAQRTTTDPATNLTVSYRYVHGGFNGTNTRFSFYFPSPSQYRGRFFESTYPTLAQEDILQNPASLGGGPGALAFAISNGAYIVLSNNNGGVPAGGALAGYRANAASAKYSVVVARQIYGAGIAQPRGYIYGASGGAYQTLGAAENTQGVWAGSMPMVQGVPNAIPGFMTVEALALRVLHDKFPQIVDAMAPGGSGNPFAGLNSEQQAVLTEVSKLGFPLRAWWQYPSQSEAGSEALALGLIPFLDPTYSNDFWTKPGYAGSETTVKDARIQSAATVTGLVDTHGLVLASVPTGDLIGANLIITSGPRAGTTLSIQSVSGNTVQVVQGNTGITAGTTVELDNSWLIALQYYQRYTLPSPDEYGWNQYRDSTGQPLYPQRPPPLLGPLLAGSAGGAVATGKFYGKMIMLASTTDIQAYAWSSDWYAKQAQAALGAAFPSSYRLWYMDNSSHDPGGPATSPAADAVDHIVPYANEANQALLDLDAWVAKGIPAPASTNYRIDSLDQVQLAPTAMQRRGVQPVVDLSASTGSQPPAEKVDVGIGQTVNLSAIAHDPPGTGDIVKVEWDLDGTGNFVDAPLHHVGPRVFLNQTTKFSQSGTYFPVVRVTSQRHGSTSPYVQIQNLASVRVVVH